MRGFIRFCSGAFVILGMITMALAALLVVLLIATGSLSNNAFTAAAGRGAGIMVVIGGFFAGASLTLVGGATYLLASIDQRLEIANAKKTLAAISAGTRPSSRTGDAALGFQDLA